MLPFIVEIPEEDAKYNESINDTIIRYVEVKNDPERIVTMVVLFIQIIGSPLYPNFPSDLNGLIFISKLVVEEVLTRLKVFLV